MDHLVERGVAEPGVITPIGQTHLQIGGAGNPQHVLGDAEDVALLEFLMAVVEDVGDQDLRLVLKTPDQLPVLLFDRRGRPLGDFGLGLVVVEPNALSWVAP